MTNNKHISLYWKCQFLGWGILSAYWAYRVITFLDYGFGFNLLNYVFDITIGIGLTHLYRYFALRLRWHTLKLSLLFRRIIPAILILSGAFMLLNNLKWHYFQVLILDKDWELLQSLLTWEPILITGLRTMSIWVLAYHLYYYYQREIFTATKNAEFSLIAKQAQLENLSNQLNPHFLFNSLNSIKSLVIEKPEMARRAIDLLSDILRTSLYEKEESLITFKEELNFVQDYVALEKIRFEERLNLSISMDKALEHTLILPLSIQLLVENAIKHGIDKRIDGGNILLSIIKIGEQIQVIVQSPGKLTHTYDNKGLGIKNLSKRLFIQYNGEASISLDNEREDTVTVTLLIPFQTS
ncbi:sensor histidine kinase [Marivirga sp.]|uniref:sensor histidine kinase n=1 Tax=Marivirga sp. TaxID=2018662 RepID=UPI0025DDE39C|nr:histidine kinase [Marivirga sp.]